MGGEDKVSHDAPPQLAYSNLSVKDQWRDRTGSADFDLNSLSL
jgi:hypothetical protein